MGFVPDLVALQETDRNDAVDIASYLTQVTGYTFALAVHSEDFGTDVAGGTAILYNRRTMSLTAGMPPTYVSSVDPRGVEKTNRQVMARFSQKLPMTSGEGPYHVAIASVHLVPGKILAQQFGAGVARSTKAAWVTEVDDKLKNRYTTANEPPLNELIVAGDFNEPRCLTSAGPAEQQQDDIPIDAAWWYGVSGVMGTEPVGCEVRPVHRVMQERYYNDAIHQVHGTNQTLMDRQYDDGINTQLPNRPYRIDHIFHRGLTEPLNNVLEASFDLTCGAPDGLAYGQVYATCRWLANSERYADHRLLWARSGGENIIAH